MTLEVKDYYEVKDFYMDEKPLVQNARVYNLGNAVRGGKFPMALDTNKMSTEIKPITIALGNAKPASGHDCFLKGIQVVFDLTWSVKASVELQRYHFIDFVSSQSTMHRISKFDLDGQYIKYVDPRIIEIMKEKQQAYNDYVAVKDHDKATALELYRELLYSNPCGFQLTGQMTTNYLQLKTMYNQRKTHRLPEWTYFCEWCESLPYFAELCLGKKDGECNE